MRAFIEQYIELIVKKRKAVDDSPIPRLLLRQAGHQDALQRAFKTVTRWIRFIRPCYC
ncbi:MAG: hypothetical protein ACJAS1_005569 [Oleiphilaceae bacterium]